MAVVAAVAVAAVTNGMEVAAVAAAVTGEIVAMISTIIVIDDMMIDEVEVEAIVITKTAVGAINVVAAINMDRSETRTTTQAAEV